MRSNANRYQTTTPRLLVSVRTVEEALLAAESGADFIDCKEPRDGALGGLPLDTIVAVVAALRRGGHALPISATIGDVAAEACVERVRAVAACGVDYVKVGIARAPSAPGLLRASAASGFAVVPVFIADDGVDDDDVQLACSLHFPALMLDTADKRAGSLFDLMTEAAVRAFVHRVRASGAMAGVAGALRIEQATTLRIIGADFAGFRSAVCTHDRTSALDVARLRLLKRAMRFDVSARMAG
jgi:(5-formylfuran-3-yl)methyl phosphate synthase